MVCRKPTFKTQHLNSKARPPIEFFNVGVANPLMITQMQILSDNFFYENPIC